MLLCLLYVLLAVANTEQLVPVDKDGFCETVEGEVGTCIEILDCNIIYETLKIIPKPVSKTIKEYMSLSHCGWNLTLPMVCCPNKQDEIPEGPELINHTNAYLLTKNVCGISVVGRVFKGTAAHINEFPWMALLVYDSVEVPFQCGGSIISERYILTAGHCITPGLKRVRLGEHTISTMNDCERYLGKDYCAPPIKEFGIEKITRHEMYWSTKFISDIALIRLNGSINFTQENLKPICLPLYNKLRRLNLNSKNLTVIGFGFTEKGKLSDVLLKVPVKVVDNVECQNLHRLRNMWPFLDDYKLCAGTKDQDSCRGDSGGPLLYLNNYDNNLRYVQHGIVSYGYSSCGTEVPAVYTRVSKYVKWILDNLQP